VRLRSGQLIEADAVEARWGTMVAACRERLLSLASTLKARGWLAAPADESEAAVRTLIEEALGELADRASTRPARPIRE
jgi:hypothetical protein